MRARLLRFASLLMVLTAAYWFLGNQPVAPAPGYVYITADATTLSKMTSTTVKSVIDGDTFRTADGSLVRLIGIDAPEKDGPYTTAEYFNAETTRRVISLIEGNTVYLQQDISNTDRYDRLLRYVYLQDGTQLNHLLVAEGYARAVQYPPDVTFAAQLDEAQVHARRLKLGIWGQ